MSLAAEVNGAVHPVLLCRAQTCCRAGCRGKRISAGREAGPCASVQVCASKGRWGKGGTVRCDNLLHLHQCSAPCAWRIKPEYYPAVQFGESSIWRYLSGMSGTFSLLPSQLLWECFFTFLASVS